MENKFNKLLDIIKTLRGPKGCPWDKEQNLYSLKNHVVEEVFELVEALDRRDINNIKEELGDLLLHVVMHSVIAEEDKLFSIDDVIELLINKLIYRHSHVFGDKKLDNSEDVLKHWEIVKEDEKPERKSMMDGIPEGLTPIHKAYKLQRKAKNAGFDWKKTEECLDKMIEELYEFKDALRNNSKQNIKYEIGDVVFTLINLSRFLGIDVDEALRETNRRFQKRIQYIENTLQEKGLKFRETEAHILEELWESAKKEVK